MKRIRRICLGSIAVLLAAFLILVGLTDDVIIDEVGYHHRVYPQIGPLKGDPAGTPYAFQAKYSDLIVEGEVVSVNPSEPAVYFYREGDFGVDFMKEEGLFHMEYELFTYQVRVTASYKGTNRLLKDWLARWEPGCNEFIVNVCIPPKMYGSDSARYTNVNVGDKMLLLLMDYADGMYTAASYASAYIIQDGEAYNPSYTSEWCEEQEQTILNDDLSLNYSGYSYSEIIRQIKDGLNGGE